VMTTCVRGDDADLTWEIPRVSVRLTASARGHDGVFRGHDRMCTWGCPRPFVGSTSSARGVSRVCPWWWRRVPGTWPRVYVRSPAC